MKKVSIPRVFSFFQSVALVMCFNSFEINFLRRIHVCFYMWLGVRKAGYKKHGYVTLWGYIIVFKEKYIQIIDY